VASAEQQAEVPTQVATVLPTGAGHTQAVVKSLEDSIAEIKTDIRELKNHRHSDFVYLITVFAAGFLLLSGAIGTVYFRLDDKIDRLTQTGIRVDTKLEDLLQRIPPVVAPAPKR
jgi:hypothetical protein